MTNLAIAGEYPYAALPLTPRVMSDLIVSLCTGELLQRSEIIERCISHHVAGNGTPPTGVAAATGSAKKALRDLAEQGEAEPTGVPGFWRIGKFAPRIIETEALDDAEPPMPPPTVDPAKVHGEGPESVYAYTFPAYMELARRDGTGSYPVKIGMTTGDVEVRIASQVGTGLPEAPTLLLVLRVAHARRIERILHDLLGLRGREITTAPGAEWFATSVDEILAIHEWLHSQGGGPPQETVSDVPSV